MMGTLAFLGGLLKAIPWWAYPLVLLLAWGWSGNHRARVNAEAAADAKQDAIVANESARQQKEVRDEEARIGNARSSAANADFAQAAKDRAAAVAASVRTAGLLKRIDDLVAASRAGASAPAVAGSAPADQLGSTLKACVDEYRALGADAADAVRRGERCTAEYQALEH